MSAASVIGRSLLPGQTRLRRRLTGLQGAVKRERIGGLAIEYEAGGGTGGRSGGQIQALLAPYLRSGTATRVARV